MDAHRTHMPVRAHPRSSTRVVPPAPGSRRSMTEPASDAQTSADRLQRRLVRAMRLLERHGYEVRRIGSDA
jgi:hypothetical protein